MVYKEITLEELKNAKAYMPIMDKEEFIGRAAIACFDKLNVSAAYDEENSRSLPNMYKENTFIKSRYLMGALVKYYFQFDPDTAGDDPYLITADEYDRYAGGRIFECLQRFKANAEVRDKVYDILSDYKDLESRLNREIHGMLNAMNDGVSRLVMALTQTMEPDEMKKMLEDLEANREALEEYVKGSADAQAIAEA